MLVCLAGWFWWALCIVLAAMPWGVKAAALGVALYYVLRLWRPDPRDVDAVFGPEPASAAAGLAPERVVVSIAHRGAGLDAPENTLAAFKYCAEEECKFVEFDVRSCAGGELMLLHDAGMKRLTGADLPRLGAMDYETIKSLEVGATHPNRHRFPRARAAGLAEALDFLTERDMRMIMDVKGNDKAVINGVLKAFATRPKLYSLAAVATYNPFVLYQIRMKDPRIVGALSFRPHYFGDLYEAESGSSALRFGKERLRLADRVNETLWRTAACFCRASAVLLHKDIVSPSEVQYWRSRGVRCVGMSVNHPLEKLYWRGVLRAPYLAHTLVGEPLQKKAESGGAAVNPASEEFRVQSAEQAIDDLPRGDAGGAVVNPTSEEFRVKSAGQAIDDLPRGDAGGAGVNPASEEFRVKSAGQAIDDLPRGDAGGAGVNPASEEFRVKSAGQAIDDLPRGDAGGAGVNPASEEFRVKSAGQAIDDLPRGQLQ